jgi:L-lactate dehydrogenase (cytochrome)
MYGLSCFANASIEEVAKAGPGPRMLQIYGLTDDYITSDLLERAEAAGYQAICVTVDTPVMSPMEKLDRWRLLPGRRPPARTMLQLLRRPDWLWRQRNLGAKELPPVVRQFLERGHVLGSEGLSKVIRKDFTWQEMARLRKRWNGAFAIKGILNSHDARKAVDVGASAVIVCNHGGLSIDGAASSISVLPGIADAVGRDIEVLLGGGIRRGVSIAKAMALGANATLSGRGFLYGLGAAGEPGVAKVISILQREFAAAMRVSGCASPQQISRDLVRLPSEYPFVRDQSSALERQP